MPAPPPASDPPSSCSACPSAAPLPVTQLIIQTWSFRKVSFGPLFSLTLRFSTPLASGVVEMPDSQMYLQTTAYLREMNLNTQRNFLTESTELHGKNKI